MGTEVATTQGTEIVLPDYLNDESLPSNVKRRGSNVPMLSFEGKVWSITVDGEKKPLMRKNVDGDEEPVSTIRVVVVAAAERRGRTYYEGNYDPNKQLHPICWSSDGVHPASDVKDPPSPTCKDCKWAIKGSRITEQGKPAAACSQHRLLAVVPATEGGKPSVPPLRMKIAITSDYDAPSKDKPRPDWHAWQQYQDDLAQKKIRHTGQVVTKMKFDPNAAYPKVLFAFDRPVSKEEWTTYVQDAVKSEEVQKLVNGSTAHDTQSVADAREEASAPKQVASTPAPAAVPAPATPAAQEPAAKPEAKAAVNANLDSILKDWS